MKQYDSSELMDIHSLAECDLNWAYTAIVDTKLALREIEKLSKNNERISEYHLHNILQKLDMFEYLIEDRRNYHDIQKEAFEKEMGE